MDDVEAVAEEDVGAIFNKGDEKKLRAEKSLVAYIDAPVKKGQKLGEYQVYKNGEISKQVNIVAANDVPRAGLIKQILKVFAETYLL
nr:hypothetical protein [Syntrophomonas palmitatica]